MQPHELRVAVNRAVLRLQNHWDRVRTAAQKAYPQYGRGVFVIDLTVAEKLFDDTGVELSYLDVADVRQTASGVDASHLMQEIKTYDVERQILVLIRHSELESGSIRVLSETHDGRPLINGDPRWLEMPCICPECTTEFAAPNLMVKCPQCAHAFPATFVHRRNDAPTVPPIVTKADARRCK